ncbi:MAG: phosphoserine phosphatase SerB [Gemmobacter sp.]
MPVLILIGAPGRGLSAALARDLARRAGAGDLRWLAEGEAAEAALRAPPAGMAALRAEADAAGVDLAILPEGNRRKRVLLADMDSTMIGQECIDELAALAGVGVRVADVTARAMRGEIGFEASLTERVALLAGLPEGAIAEVLATRITHAPGGRALVATMRAAGAHCALVSGGFTAFTGPVAAALGFDEHRANVLEVAGGRLTGRVRAPILGREAKAAALSEICAARGCAAAEVLAVGDGANDLAMLAAAGLGVALHAKPAVAAAARVQINHGDLTALLYPQGYARADFAA